MNANLFYNKEILEDAADWLQHCVFADNTDNSEELSADEIVVSINVNYPGGFTAFIEEHQ